jgi:hypothetical protein
VDIKVPASSDFAAIDDAILLIQSPERALDGGIGRLVVHDPRAFLQCNPDGQKWRVMAVYGESEPRIDESGEPIPQRLDSVMIDLRSTGACRDIPVQLHFPSGSDRVDVYVMGAFALAL